MGTEGGEREKKGRKERGEKKKKKKNVAEREGKKVVEAKYL